jgi:hypothetical protein
MVACAAALVSAGGWAVRADQTVRFDVAVDAPYISMIGDSTEIGVRRSNPESGDPVIARRGVAAMPWRT